MPFQWAYPKFLYRTNKFSMSRPTATWMQMVRGLSSRNTRQRVASKIWLGFATTLRPAKMSMWRAPRWRKAFSMPQRSSRWMALILAVLTAKNPRQSWMGCCRIAMLSSTSIPPKPRWNMKTKQDPLLLLQSTEEVWILLRLPPEMFWLNSSAPIRYPHGLYIERHYLPKRKKGSMGCAAVQGVTCWPPVQEVLSPVKETFGHNSYGNQYCHMMILSKTYLP